MSGVDDHTHDEGGTTRNESNRGPDDTPAEKPAVSAYASTEDCMVFSESGNSDAWIATDYTVEIEP